MKVFDLLVALLLTTFLFLHINNQKVNITQLENRYQNSQYVNPSGYKYFIDDPEVYQVAGWHYIHGESPDKVNFEHQPLAKYLIGLSLMVFQNASYLQLIIAFLCLFLTIKLSRIAFGQSLWAFIPAVFLTADPLFQEQSRLVYLDIYQLLAILLLFFLVLKKRFVLSMLALGLVLLSNSVWSGMITGFVALFFVFIKDRKNLWNFLKFVPITILVYLAGYLVFLLKNSPIDFIMLHIKQIRFYLSYVPEYPKGEVFRVIFQGSWRKWFGDHGFMPAEPWSILWPIGLVLSYVPIISKNRSPLVVLFTLWISVWLIFLSTKLIFPRYLLVILPFIYILAIMGIHDYWDKWQRSKRKS